MTQHLIPFIVLTMSATLLYSPASGIGLDAYRWKNRLLFIFSPNDSNADYAAFNERLLKSPEEVKDRDLVVFRVFEKGPSRVDTQLLNPQDARGMRQSFKITPGQLTVVLVGKDGGVKLVQHHQAHLETIFERIDSMPMRQMEMDKNEKTDTP